MLTALVSRFVPEFRTACIRLRLNQGKTADLFSDLWELIDHYLRNGELNRAEALSHSLIALAEGESLVWTDPERSYPLQKSLSYQRLERRAVRIFAACAGLILVVLFSQHEWILTQLALRDLRDGRTSAAIGSLRADLAIARFTNTDPSVTLRTTLAAALLCDGQIMSSSYYINDVLEQDSKNVTALALDAELQMLRGNFNVAFMDTLQMGTTSPNFLPNYVQCAVRAGGMEIEAASASVEYLTGLRSYKELVPEKQSSAALAEAMAALCEANGDKTLAGRWYKQALTLEACSDFKVDRVRYVQSARRYANLLYSTNHPLDAKTWHWRARQMVDKYKLSQLPVILN